MYEGVYLRYLTISNIQSSVPVMPINDAQEKIESSSRHMRQRQNYNTSINWRSSTFLNVMNIIQFMQMILKNGY